MPRTTKKPEFVPVPVPTGFEVSIRIEPNSAATIVFRPTHEEFEYRPRYSYINQVFPTDTPLRVSDMQEGLELARKSDPKVVMDLLRSHVAWVDENTIEAYEAYLERIGVPSSL